MKSFKNMLVIMALFAIGSVSAKRTGAAAKTQPAVTTPTKETTTGSIKQFFDKILKGFDDTMAANNKFVQDFLSSVEQSKTLTDTDKMGLFGNAAKMYNNLYDALEENREKIIVEIEQMQQEKVTTLPTQGKDIIEKETVARF